MRDDMYIFFHSSKRLFILGRCSFAVVRLSFWFIDYFFQSKAFNQQPVPPKNNKISIKIKTQANSQYVSKELP